MRKIVYMLLASSLFFPLFSINALAAVTEAEVNEVLLENGWDREKFEQFLDYYELTIEDFESKEDLATLLGTPITEENLNRLLADYGFTRNDLDELLGEFGMTVEDHWSIEELDASIDFYINNQEDINELEDFIAAIGITDEEGESLFNHFEGLDQLQLEEQMNKVGSRLEYLMSLDPEAELTEKQIDEVISIWEEMMKIVNIYPKFYLIDGNTKKPISFRTLAAMNEFDSDALLIELYNEKNTLLLDMQISDQMLSSDFAINAGEKLTDIAALAGELTKLRHETLPNTASNYGLNILIGFICILIGVSITFTRMQRVKYLE